MNLLEIQNVSKSFGRKKILSSQQNLAANQGLIALTGKNGSGKSTFLRILATLTSATDGKISIEGKDINNHQSFVQERIGYAEGSESGFFPRLTGKENLDLFALHRKQREPDFSFWNQFPSDVLDTPFQDCSSGMKHTLHLARSLLHKPKILLLDEISKSFDFERKVAFRSFLQQYQKDHLILLATHDPEEIQLANTQWKIENGTIFS